jgi:3-oxoacyl-[acyl-carrier protein] reductase
MDLGLKDRVALVAASSQGMGKAVAMALAREGDDRVHWQADHEQA